MRHPSARAFLLLASSLGLGCERQGSALGGAAAHVMDPCAIVLMPGTMSDRLDREISLLQDEAKKAHRPGAYLEKLGWKFVSKARMSFDPGYLKLAEKCAECMEARERGSMDALLLRGHVLHALHRFREAETAARELVARREVPFDFGLLGDSLMEQGRLDEATGAYQRMLDLKPGLQSYARAAHVRWLKGDLVGAMELMRMAVRAGSARDPESLAWAASRLALYELQAGDFRGAKADAESALGAQGDYPHALLVLGRVLLADGKASGALAPLKRACELNPLPECQWILADALRLAGRLQEARSLEDELLLKGAANDPRTFALYLSTRRMKPEVSLRLTEREMEERADVFTHDALAWALFASGKKEEAWARMQHALAEGTEDARLFFHAAVLARAVSRSEAASWIERAGAIQQMLFPSEKEQLSKLER